MSSQQQSITLKTMREVKGEIRRLYRLGQMKQGLLPPARSLVDGAQRTFLISYHVGVAIGLRILLIMTGIGLQLFSIWIGIQDMLQV